MSAEGGVVTQGTKPSPFWRVLFVVASGVFWLCSVITEVAFPQLGLPGAMGQFVRANGLALLLPTLVAAYIGGALVTAIYAWVLGVLGSRAENFVVAIIAALVVGIVTTLVFTGVFGVFEGVGSALFLWMSLIVAAALFCGWMSARSSRTAHTATA